MSEIFTGEFEETRVSDNSWEYAKIIGLSEPRLPMNPAELPSTVFLPAPFLGDIEEAYFETLDTGGETAQVVDFKRREKNFKKTKIFKGSHLWTFSGKEDAVLKGPSDDLSHQLKRFMGIPALFAYHVHPDEIRRWTSRYDPKSNYYKNTKRRTDVVNHLRASITDYVSTINIPSQACITAVVNSLEVQFFLQTYQSLNAVYPFDLLPYFSDFFERRYLEKTLEWSSDTPDGKIAAYLGKKNIGYYVWQAPDGEIQKGDFVKGIEIKKVKFVNLGA